MGTNFYLNERHVGKRSAAGWYCWDCKQTLCADGEHNVHHTKLEPDEERKKVEEEHVRACRGGLSKSGFSCYAENIWTRPDVTWHSKCPSCGKRPKEEELDQGAVGRELGFNKSKPKPKRGVASCCSFTWAMPKEEALSLSENRHFLDRLTDEYGREYSHKEFLDVLSECPIEFADLIGQYFS